MRYAGENVVCDIDNSGQGTFSITIPSNATAGTTTMRIRMKWSGSDCGSPCGTTTYGEVEDYSINIVGWLLVSPTGGTIAPGYDQLLDVTFDATDLAVGVYTADILVSSNDPGQPLVTVPATLNVSLGNPQIIVSPSSLNFGDVQVGLSNTLQFSITNTGTGVLAGTITTPTGFTVSAAKDNGDNVLSFAVNEGITEYYDVLFAPTAAQPYSGNIVIAHNAPGSPDYVAVSGNGLPGPEPDIALNPTDFYVVLPPDNMTDELLQISNIGDATLTYNTAVSYDSKSGWFNPSLKTGYITKNLESSSKEELSPFKQIGYSVPEAIGDILMELDIQTSTGDDQLLGCEFDGTYLWFTGGGGSSGLYGNQLYKTDVNGNLIATYTQGTTSDWGMRDLAFDGTYLYAGDDNAFYQINPTTGTVTTLFTGNLGLGTIRALAYNPNNSHFYAANWDTQIIEFDVSGTQYATYTAPGLTGMYGLAYDEFTGHIWIFNRTGSPATTFYEYNLSTQALTGVSLQVPMLTGLTDQMNGGAFFATDLVSGKIVLGGVVQGTANDMFFAMELGDIVTFSWLSITNNGAGSILGGGSVNATVHFDATGLDFGIYTGNVEVSSNDPYDPLILVPCTLEVANDVNVNLTVLLEGPYNGYDMDTHLNSLLPLAQPFNSSPWNYPGSETVASIPSTDIVEWVLVELRDASSPDQATGATTIGRQAGFLMSDGQVVTIDEDPIMSFATSITDGLFVVVYQRNHIAVISNTALTASGGVYTYDFSTGENQAYGGIDGHGEIAVDVWGMYAGDGDANGTVEINDKNVIWSNEAATKGYLNGDFNMDVQVDNKDKNDNWLPNGGKGSQVPD